MATFNFHDKVEAQNIAGHDIFVGSDPGRTRAIEALTDLLTAAREAIASGSMEHDAGDQATAEISTAITALAVPDPEASQRARLSMARVREILTTATLVPALADAIAKAVEAVRGLR